MSSSGKKTLKVLFSVVAIVSAVAYIYGTTRTYSTGGAANNGTGNAEDFNPQAIMEERERIDAAAAKYAGLTEEQQERLADLRAEMPDFRSGERPTSGTFREMRQKMDEIVTPEQQDKMREYRRTEMQSRRAQQEAKMRAAMTPAEWDRYEEKRRERRGNRGGFGGPGGGRDGGRGGRRGGEGGPPPGPPPSDQAPSNPAVGA